jgi:hypothetical protein
MIVELAIAMTAGFLVITTIKNAIDVLFHKIDSFIVFSKNT